MEALRKCHKCGLEAHTVEDLEGFVTSKSCLHGNENWCKICKAAQMKVHYEANQEKRVAQHKVWCEANKEEIAAYHKIYRQTPEGKAAISRGRARRRALKLGAWVPLTYIWNQQWDAIHEEATKRRLLGEDVDIDHIYPLSKGGAEHPDNLQIIPASENGHKYTKLPESGEGFTLYEWYQQATDEQIATKSKHDQKYKKEIEVCIEY